MAAGRSSDLLLPGLQVLERNLPGFRLTLADDNGKIRGFRGMGKLGPQSPFHQVHLGADPGITESTGDLQARGCALRPCRQCQQRYPFPGLQLAQRDHYPVKPDRKPAGGHIIPAEQVREPVCPAAKDLVLCPEVLGKSFKDHTGIIVEPPGNPEVQRIVHARRIKALKCPPIRSFSGNSPGNCECLRESTAFDQGHKGIGKIGLIHGFKRHFSGHQNPSCPGMPSASAVRRVRDP